MAARVLNDLIRKNVILVTAKNSYTESREIGLYKNYEEWCMYSQGYTPDSTLCTQEGSGYVLTGGVEVYTCVTGKKETIKRNIKDISRTVLNEPFEIFWEVYPRRQAKQDALKAFRKLNPDDELMTVIFEAVKRQTASEAWQKNNGQYIPLPATYLNGRRREDEITATQSYEARPKRKLLNDIIEGDGAYESV